MVKCYDVFGKFMNIINGDLKKKKNWPKKLGTVSLAILCVLAERGAWMLGEMLASPRESLRTSLRKIDALKTVGDYYEILNNLDRDSARTIIWRLKQKGLVGQKKSEGFNLTDSGKKFLNFLSGKNQKRNWDGKWRIIMFDVPEHKKGQREYLRSKLLSENYQPLQKSVFIGKQPISEDVLQKMISRDIYQYLRMIVVGEIDDEKVLENFS